MAHIHASLVLSERTAETLRRPVALPPQPSRVRVAELDHSLPAGANKRRVSILAQHQSFSCIGNDPKVFCKDGKCPALLPGARRYISETSAISTHPLHQDAEASPIPSIAHSTRYNSCIVDEVE